MSNINYHVLPNSIVVNFNGQTVSIAKGDSRFEPTLAAIRDDKLDDIPTIVDNSKAIKDSELELREGLLWLDGEALPEALSERVLAYQEERLPYSNLVKFARKLRENPSYNSRVQLYKFLEHNGHPITSEGNFVAYRGVSNDLKDVHTGKFDNSVGSVCEIPRSEVDDNPNNTCSHGLHVACWSYASTFGSKTVQVEVDPRDVVCVPTDYNGTKMRVCKFKVMDVVNSMNNSKAVNSSYEPVQDSVCIDTDYCVCNDCTTDVKELDTEGWTFNNSSALDWADYNHNTGDLVVCFSNGNEYSYSSIPKDTWESFKSAPSAGRFFLLNIKNQF